MDAISFKNFRSFKEIDPVKLKKLNILIGGNSSGKSSFLRFFPLLRQSMETETKGPILWYDKYVDFGTFDNAINRDSKGEEIVFGFLFDGSSYSKIESTMFGWEDFDEDTCHPTFEVKVYLKKRKSSWQTFMSKFECFIKWNLNETDHFVFDLNEKDPKITVVYLNGIKLPFLISVDQNRIIPTIESTDPQDEVDFPFGYFYAFPLEYVKAIRSILQNSNVKREKLTSIIKKIKPDSMSGFQVNVKRVFSTVSITNDQISELRNAWLINYLSQALFITRRAVQHVAHKIHYITPTRANAERFYRLKDLQIKQVDFDGRNLAIFLNSLTDAQKQEFSQWSQDNFGMSIKTKEKEGQLSIYVNDENTGVDENIIDTGFGYSQVLPIIASLWVAVNEQKEKGRPSLKIPRIFVIEQPELHLHPKLQAKLGAIFAKSVSIANQKDIDLRLVIETHSQTLVNKISRIVAYSESSLLDAFQVLIFDKNKKSTEIKVATVDKGGNVLNWPYGFFEEDDIEMASVGDY
ncbi:DUF3696 domain-containing protein [Chromobacterium piscinae]|uniref:DUF3696 domain-containing protein n=1 Tax=Chromobacterium piscinae TaxID=686831 RepID=UPI001E52BBE7|nr:DUF3696 domain-containing protein [Chromobacterium piscinae]MCD5330163.1 DUF3696 domain-containing protein [Chromobacterium piscinae]